MKRSEVGRDAFIPCEVTPSQVCAFEEFCDALHAFYNKKTSISPETAKNAVRALDELSQCQNTKKSNDAWQALRTHLTQPTGQTVLVTNNTGDELMLQLDAAGRPHIGSWTLFDAERIPQFLILFYLVQTSGGWIMRLENEGNSTEIFLGETIPGDINWTDQPDYGTDVVHDDEIEEENSAIAAFHIEYIDETGQSVLKAKESDNSELIEEIVTNNISDERREENTMHQNSNVPPKRPPEHIIRNDRTNVDVSPRYQQPLTPSPPQQSNTLALISLIAGISSVLLLLLSICTWCLGVIPLLIGSAAAVMGFISKKQIDRSQGMLSGRKMAVAGIILGVAGAVLSLVFMLIGLLVVGFAGFMDFL